MSGTVQALDRPAAAALIEAATFGRAAANGGRRIGIEAELIAVDADTRSVASLTRRVLPAVRSHATRTGWTEMPAVKGAPRFAVAGGGTLTFEPGGQLEYATLPFTRPADLLEHLRAVVPPLVAAAADAGIDLIGVGIDPCNGIEAAPLQIEAERYRCMDAYFATLGRAGARMMRQTASIQMSVDAGSDAARTWRLLNALAPVITAMFGNSRDYAGVDTGQASYRATTWRQLDPSRTGLAWQAGDPLTGYTEFALGANAMFLTADGEYRPFSEWIERGAASPASLETHLTTLFPEVRPRGYFEVRSIDALPPDAYAAPVLLLAGLTADDRATDQACEVLGTPEPTLLARAATCGLRDPALASMAADLVRIAVTACRRVRDFGPGADLDSALGFFERYTLRGRCPADDARAGLIATAA